MQKNTTMRLSKRILAMIKKAILTNFGEVDIYLFGSRVDDNKKGGDIDIAVDVNLSRKEFNQHKKNFIVALIKVDFDFKIDLVQYNNQDNLLKKEIQQTAVKIN